MGAVAATDADISDDQARERFPLLLARAEIKQFSQVSELRFFVALGIDLLIIILAIWISEKNFNVFVYILSIIIIGSRLHALAILMHEATHYRAASQRWLNEAIGEILAFMITITMQGYRVNYFAHHQELNTDGDPDWLRKQGDKDFSFPMTKRVILSMLSQFALGLKFYSLRRKVMKSGQELEISKRMRNVRIAAYLILAGASIILGFWKLLILYWIVPLLTSFMFFMQIRSIAEHFAIEYEHPFNQTRTVISPFWERWLFAPHCVGYHIEHHLYPSAPFYRLPELHSRLGANHEYRKSAHITRGYLTGLFGECNVGPPPRRMPISKL